MTLKAALKVNPGDTIYCRDTNDALRVIGIEIHVRIPPRDDDDPQEVIFEVVSSDVRRGFLSFADVQRTPSTKRRFR